MKKLLTLAIATTLLTPAYVFADDEVTPLQLKVMQTRKFLKPSLEVAKASTEDGESIGGRCVNQVSMFKPEPNGKNLRAGEVRCMFMPKSALFSSEDVARITYEISPSQDDAETTVRMKIFVNWREPKPVTDPEVYSKRFKSIGDLVFIEAIPLSPAVQN